MIVSACAVAIALVAPPGAWAESAPPEKASLLPDSQTWAEIRLAQVFWDARGVAACPEIGFAATPLPGQRIAGFAVYGLCQITLNSTDPVWQMARQGRDAWRLEMAATECAVVVHEVGHARGLGHTPTGVMSEETGGKSIPWDCWRWARSLMPYRFAKRAWRKVLADRRERR